MSAPTDSSGTMKYWQGGLPFDGVQKSANDCGTMRFWICGLPGSPIFPASAPPAPTPIAVYFAPNDLFNLMIPA